MNIEEINYPAQNTHGINFEIKITDCPKLIELKKGFGSVSNIFNLESLKTVDLTTCEYINSNSFFKCPNLEEIIGWGDHELDVGEHLFQLCPKININTWTDKIVSSATEILINTAIKEMHITGLNSDLPSFFNCRKLKKVIYALDIRLESLNGMSFLYCESLEEVVLPTRVNEIGERAFEGTKISSFDTTGKIFRLNSFNHSLIKEL